MCCLISKLLRPLEAQNVRIVLVTIPVALLMSWQYSILSSGLAVSLCPPSHPSHHLLHFLDTDFLPPDTVLSPFSPYRP